MGSDYNQSSMGSAGTGAGTTGAYDTTGAGIGQTGTGIGQTGTGIGQTSTGITGTTGYETGTTGTLGGTTGQTGTINASEVCRDAHVMCTRTAIVDPLYAPECSQRATRLHEQCLLSCMGCFCMLRKSTTNVHVCPCRYDLCRPLQIIDSKTFTKTEDHEVLIEKKRYELEHRPVEKQVWHSAHLLYILVISSGSLCSVLLLIMLLLQCACRQTCICLQDG